jgi:hypothetical protein
MAATRRSLLALIAVMAILPPPASAQAVFDVGSVKPNTTGSQRVSMGFTPDGYAASNAPLRLVVLSAYGVRPAQLTGGPAWMDVNRFDIVVKAAGAAPRDALMVMLRAWLADRSGWPPVSRCASSRSTPSCPPVPIGVLAPG